MELLGIGILGIGIAIGIGSFGEAYLIRQALDSVARQPEQTSTIRTLMIIGAALVETGLIYAFILGLLLWIKL